MSIRFNVREHVTNALILSVPLAALGGALTWATQEGLFNFTTDTHHVVVEMTDVPPTDLPECQEEDGSSSTLPCVWNGERGAETNPDSYRVNPDLSITPMADLTRQV